MDSVYGEIRKKHDQCYELVSEERDVRLDPATFHRYSPPLQASLTTFYEELQLQEWTKVVSELNALLEKTIPSGRTLRTCRTCRENALKKQFSFLEGENTAYFRTLYKWLGYESVPFSYETLEIRSEFLRSSWTHPSFFPFLSLEETGHQIHETTPLLGRLSSSIPGCISFSIYRRSRPYITHLRYYLDARGRLFSENVWNHRPDRRAAWTWLLLYGLRKVSSLQRFPWEMALRILECIDPYWNEPLEKPLHCFPSFAEGFEEILKCIRT